ncbi:DUF998 domain-containing protein [Amaricoccus macauensis]|uniref:DUF998 domain-containing protein n=1 Tax=Amaricoccus macauensis TaxID=57001 RepID=UPI003C79BF02
MFEAPGARHSSAEVVADERPELLLFCGIVGFIGSLTPLVTLLVSWPIAEHDFIADTVSDLARGPHKWIMDLGFYVSAAGLLGLAIGAAHVHLGRMAWSLGIFCLCFLALFVVLLGLWDEFHNVGDEATGMTVHTKLTFFLGPLYTAGPLLTAKGAAGISRTYGWLFVASAVIWLSFAAAFLMAPTAYDGIIEKIAIAATLLWTLPLSHIFFWRGYDKLHRLT